MLAIALIGVVAGIVLVRRGWAGRRPLAVVGWAIVLAALALLTIGDGAWGLAMGGAIGITAALALVLWAGWSSPAKSTRAPRTAPASTIPVRASDIARRVAVFALAVPVAFIAAQWFAFGVQALARAGGATAADTAVLMLGLQPLVWGVIMALQLLQPGPARMLTAPAVVAGLGTAAWALA